MNQKAMTFRKNVAIVVVNHKGLLLACRRSDEYQAWQLPQGGVEANESFESAMWREMLEEIGTTKAELIGRLEQSICYEWPKELHRKGYCGQEQTYFLVRLKRGAKIILDAHGKPEFDQTEWVTLNDFLERIEGFKADAYRTALALLAEAYPHHFNRSG
jgi:putative (di)nucleoside polyphosphate hydrolase